jgi:general secretion pathway protein G
MLVVLVLLGVLSTIVLPTAAISAQRQREVELKRNLWLIRDAIDAYHVAAMQGAVSITDGRFGYPATLQTLVDGIPDQRAGHQGERAVFLRAIPRDPFANADMAPEDSWAYRAYETPANAPRAGGNVYDVHSKSTLQALDKTWLKDW